MNLQDQLQDTSEELKSINEKQEQRVHNHRTRAEKLTVAFLVFQALYSIAITVRSSSSTSLIRSKEWVVHFIAILLSSTIFFIAFLDSVINFYWTQYELDINYLDLEEIQSKIKVAKNKRSSPIKSHSIQIEGSRCSDQDDDQQEPTVFVRSSPDPVILFKRKAFIYLTVLALVGFTVTELYACRLLLSGYDQ